MPVVAGAVEWSPISWLFSSLLIHTNVAKLDFERFVSPQNMPRSPFPFEFVLSIVLSASLVSGYSFTFTSQPQQCTNLSLEISGSGTPPYSVLIIPYGPTPLANSVEVRTIVYQQFPGDASSVSFQLKYPTNSQFVAVVSRRVFLSPGVHQLIDPQLSTCVLARPQVSDSSGFGSGGTSVAANVLTSSDTSCFNATQTVSPDFPFNINPPNQVVQCSPSRLWWDPSQVQG